LTPKLITKLFALKQAIGKLSLIGNAGQDNAMKSAVNVLCLAKHKLHEPYKSLKRPG